MAETTFSFSITIEGSPGLVITNPSPPKGNIGQLYRHSFVIQGGTPPYSWETVSGSPPPGVLFEMGTFEGVPTTPGNFGMSLRVRDSTPISS